MSYASRVVPFLTLALVTSMANGAVTHYRMVNQLASENNFGDSFSFSVNDSNGDGIGSFDEIFDFSGHDCPGCANLAIPYGPTITTLGKATTDVFFGGSCESSLNLTTLDWTNQITDAIREPVSAPRNFTLTRDICWSDANGVGSPIHQFNTTFGITVWRVEQLERDSDGDGFLDVDDAFPEDASRFSERLAPPAIIELPVIGAQLISSFGEIMEVPASATAVALNVTVVDPAAAGFITVWPCGVDRPLASNVNFTAAGVVPNGVIASIGSEGLVCFYAQAELDLVVDIAGWFEGAAYVGSTPTRLVDTRDDTGGASGRVDPNNTLTVPVTDMLVLDATGAATTIPSDIGTVALNITAVQSDAAGFMTVYPCDVERPLSSNLNYSQNQVVANGVVATVSADGSVCVYSSASADVIVDLAGWFPTDAFTGSTPKRLVDTRDGTGGRLGALNAAR